ncbi:MAG: DUF4386 domain-containing protein [Longimicrobiales bacterium]
MLAPMNHTTDVDRLRTWARGAGVAYLAIIVTGIFAEFFVRSALIVDGDAGATAANLAGEGGRFRVGIAAEFVMLVADVGLAAALYVVFRPVSRDLALLAACFRLTHAAVVAVNLLNVWVPLSLVGGGPWTEAFEPGQVDALVALLLETHGVGYQIGLLFFGVHCLLMGVLVVRAGYVPAVLGVLLMVAGVGYVADTLGRTLLANYAQWESVFLVAVFVPALVAELSFALWLVIRGVDGRRVPAVA